MFKVLYEKQKAHDRDILCCSWGNLNNEFCEEDKSIALTTDQENLSTEFEFLNFRRCMTGDVLTTGSLDNTVKIWYLMTDKTFQLQHTFTDSKSCVISVDIDKNTKYLASNSLDSKIVMRNLKTGTINWQITSESGKMWTVAFSPCSQYLISGSKSGTISMLCTEDGKIKHVFKSENDQFNMSIAYSPDGKYIASATCEGFLNVFDVESGKILQTIEAHGSSVRSICFSPDCVLLLSGGDDGFLKLHDPRYGDLAGSIYGHSSWIQGVSFSDDGKRFVSCSNDSTVKFWHFQQRRCMYKFQEHNGQIFDVKYNPINDKVASVGSDQSINIYHSPKKISF